MLAESRDHEGGLTLTLTGCGLSIFASILQEIFYFKPQTIYVSVVFLTVIGYVLGEFMAYAIPRWGFLKYLNPGPFNQKEHAAITIMASAAAQSATSTQALAAQELFYGGYPSRAAGVFITFSSQLIGFGIAGLLRDVLLYPTRMIWVCFPQLLSKRCTNSMASAHEPAHCNALGDIAS